MSLTFFSEAEVAEDNASEVVVVNDNQFQVEVLQDLLEALKKKKHVCLNIDVTIIEKCVLCVLQLGVYFVLLANTLQEKHERIYSQAFCQFEPNKSAQVSI